MLLKPIGHCFILCNSEGFYLVLPSAQKYNRSAFEFRQAYGLTDQGEASWPVNPGPDYRCTHANLYAQWSIFDKGLYHGIYANVSYVHHYLATTHPFNTSWAPSCFAMLTMGK